MRQKLFQQFIRKPFGAKPPTVTAIISDVLLWSILALLGVGVYQYFFAHSTSKEGQTIHLQFEDANEISKGSAVRVMGTDIGYVDAVQLDQDHVNVVVKTYPNTLEIPSGSVFTILFTGLGGAKSIEVEFPKTALQEDMLKQEPQYLTEKPIRMHHAENAMTDITKALQNGAENTADFFGKRKSVEELQFNIHQAHEHVSSVVGSLEKAQVSIETLESHIVENVEPVKNSINQIKPMVSLLNQKLGTTVMQKNIPATIHWWHQTIQRPVLTHQEDMIQLHQSCTVINNRFQSLEHFVTAKPVEMCLSSLSDWMTQFSQQTVSMNQRIHPAQLKTLQTTQHSLQSFNQWLNSFRVQSPDPKH